MLRREPTSVTLAAKDIEMFKELVIEQQNKKERKADSKILKDNDSDSEGRDDVTIPSFDRKRNLQSRLGLEEEDSEDIEGPLYKKTHF